MTKRRVVITGLGIVSPLGTNVDQAWQRLLNGESCVSQISKFDASSFKTRIAAEVRDYHSNDYFEPREIRRIDPFIEYGLAAADLAHQHAGFDQSTLDKSRVGVCIGSGIGGLKTIEETSANYYNQSKKISPFFIPASIINMTSGLGSIRLGLEGPNFSVTTACATGSHAIGLSARTIAYGDADVMLAGGAESSCTPIGIGGFSALRALSVRNDAPKEASRPFDQDRDGFVMAEGGCVLVLESLEHALKRRANIIAECVGFGMSGDAHHITQPKLDGSGAKKAMELALNDAKVQPEYIDYINAHGTSTPAGDQIEPLIVKEIFGDKPSLAMSSTKSMHGHLLGAAGALESAWSCLAIRDQVVPPTINLDRPDSVCEGINMVPHHSQQRSVSYVINNSFGFGGTNTSLVFKAYD